MVHADQRESDPGVSGSRLHNRSTGTKFSFLLRTLDDPNRRPVFHTAARVQVLQFGKHVRRPGRNQAFQLQHRGLADQLGDVVGNAQAGHLRSLRNHTTGYGGRRRIVNSASVVLSVLSWN